MTNEKTILVVGGTGKTGRRVARRLAARELPHAVASRSGERPFDWHDPSTWEPALRGVHAIYLAYAPDLAVPGADAQIRAFARLAVDRGARRLVLLSGRGEEQAHVAEQGVRESGAAFTVLRAAWFDQNFSEGHLLDSVRSGQIVLPAGTVAEPFVDADDIADVAVAALTSDAHDGLTYELTGPRLLTFAAVADELARAARRPVAYMHMPSSDYAAALVEAHVPAAEAGFLAELFATVLDGRNAHVTDDVQRALGRAPRDFSDYAREVAATGAWTA